MKQRLGWVDVVRCFGMFAIYLGHFGEQAGHAYTFVYTHHVALFFFISGAELKAVTPEEVEKKIQSVCPTCQSKYNEKVPPPGDQTEGGT